MGLFIFSIGFFKKVIIADSFAIWANAGFDTAKTLNLFEAWATSTSYTFQLYFDFSGYADMAIGAALLFNINLPINFNSPYKATNIQDFWRRWHMTLSRFLKDYVYVPLGGNRKGEFRTYNNLLATFIIGGIWHGAGWTFLFWGGIHGIALVIHRTWNKLGFKLWPWLAWLITFNFINIAWVFFRAKEWSDAVKILEAMFTINVVLPGILESKLSFLQQDWIVYGNWFQNIDIYGGRYLVPFIIVGFIFILIFKNSTEKLYSLKLNYKTALLTAITFILSAWLSLSETSNFLYFNF